MVVKSINSVAFWLKNLWKTMDKQLKAPNCDWHLTEKQIQFVSAATKVQLVMINSTWYDLLPKLNSNFPAWSSYHFAHGLQTPNEGINQKKSENLGRCGRQNMLQPYPKIWEWEWIFDCAVKAISSPGVRSPCLILFNAPNAALSTSFVGLVFCFIGIQYSYYCYFSHLE